MACLQQQINHLRLRHESINHHIVKTTVFCLQRTVGIIFVETLFSGSSFNPNPAHLCSPTTLWECLSSIGFAFAWKCICVCAADLITSDDFNQGSVLSPEQLISGKLAGVSVTSGSGAPGDGQAIRIRGLGSLSLTNSPLIVVDGFCQC